MNILSDKLYIDFYDTKLNANVFDLLTYANPEYFQKMNMGISVFKVPKTLQTFTWKPKEGRLEVFRGEYHKLMMVDPTLRFEEQFKSFPVNLQYINTDFDFDDFQKGAIDAVMSRRQGIVHAVTSAGKSLMILKAGIDLKQRMLIVVHRKILMEQFIEDIEKYVRDEHGNKITIGIIGSGKKTIGDITIAIDKTLAKNLDEYKDVFGTVFMDECFIAGTKISTPDGFKNIEDIKPGDKVYNMSGVGTVEAVSQKNAEILYKITFNKNQIYCTANHPFYTQRGWIPASHLTLSDILYTHASQNNLSAMQKMQMFFSRFSKKKVLFSNMPQQLDEKEQSIIQEKCQIEDFNNLEKNETQASFSGWERKEDTRSRKCFYEYFKQKIKSVVGEFFCGENKKDSKKCSASLQNRHCVQRNNDCNRNRWIFSLFFREKKTGQEKRTLFTKTRMDSIEILKPGDIEWNKRSFSTTEKVYNLQVSGHASYIANGILVHNCHLAPTSTMLTVINALRCERRYGFSGTLKRKDQKEFLMYGTFGQVIYEIRREQLEEKGRVVKVESNIIVSDTLFDYQGTISAIGITRASQVMEKALAYDPGRMDLILAKVAKMPGKTIVLSKLVEPCYILQKMLMEQYGIKSGVITGRDAKSSLVAYEEMKHQDLKVIFATVGCVSTGVSISDLNNLVLIAPIYTNELLLHQIRGRLMRTAKGKTHGDFYFVYDQHVFPRSRLDRLLAILKK